MIAMSVDEIAEAVSGQVVPGRVVPGRVVSGQAISGSAQRQHMITGLSRTDSREVEPGDIFFAKPGEETDGHLFVPQALEAGAALLVVDHEVAGSVPQIVVADVVVALGALARAVIERARGIGRLRIVGITGSNGKTTTKNLVASILSPLGETVAARESYNNEVGAPVTMLAVRETTEFLVAEMGASALGEIARLVAMARPDVGVVLSVGLAHAGVFGGIEATVRAKTEMVSDLAADATAVLNRDDPRVASMAQHTQGNVLWFGLSAGADVRADDIRISNTGTEFTLILPDGVTRPVAFRVLGEHHVMNALAAAAVCHVLGASADQIVAGLESVTRAERWRMEVLGGARGVSVINDAYNASPDSMAAALKTLAQVARPPARSIAVLGEMTELGEFSGEEHDRIGLLAVRLNISQLVVVGAGARRMHISTINEGSWDGESVYLDTPEAAYEMLEDTVKSGDVILVKSSNAANLRFLGDRLGELFS